LVNGVYRHDLSDIIEEEGIILSSFADAAQSEIFNKHFAQYADKVGNPFVWLNTALSNDGFFIEVKTGKVALKPIHIVHISVADSQTFFQTRNLVILEKDAEAQIIETFITEDGSSKTFGNTVTEIVVAENAK